MSTIRGTAKSETINGTSNADMIYGMGGNDIINGGSGNDTLYGGELAYGANTGDDTIDGGAGADDMYGGDGNDIYYVDNTGDIVEEISNNGTDTVISKINNYTLPNYVENLKLDDPSGVTIGYGNSLDNTITGNSYNNSLYGGAGNDILNGGSGRDYMQGDAGNDTYYVDDSRDSVWENAGNGTDTVITSIDNYDLKLSGEVENLTLNNSSTVLTGSGNNFDNTILGNSYNNTLNGYEGNDTLKGDYGNDTLNGGAGNDIIKGGYGNDIINGGIGNDTLTDEAGNDTYTFTSGDGKDTITDTSGTDSITFDSSNVSKSNIALFMDSSNKLYIDYGTTTGSDQITVSNQATNTIENVKAEGSYYLTNSDINQLVQDMTAYATNNGITLSSVADVKSNTELMTMISNSWKAA